MRNLTRWADSKPINSLQSGGSFIFVDPEGDLSQRFHRRYPVDSGLLGPVSHFASNGVFRCCPFEHFLHRSSSLASGGPEVTPDVARFRKVAGQSGENLSG